MGNVLIVCRGWSRRAFKQTPHANSKVKKPRGEGGALGSELNVALLHDASYIKLVPLLRSSSNI